MAPSLARSVPLPHSTSSPYHTVTRWKFKLHPRKPASSPIASNQGDSRSNGDRQQPSGLPTASTVPMPTSTWTAIVPSAAPSTATAGPDRTGDDVMPVPPAVMLVLTVAVATMMCMCTIWCIRRCGRSPTEPYADEYEAVEAAGYRPYARNGGSGYNSPRMTQTSRPATTTSRHSMLDPSPVVGHQMLEDDEQDDIFLHMHAPNRSSRYSRPRSYPDWHQGHAQQPRDRPSRRQGGRTPLPVYSVIMSPMTAAHTADLLQRELELLHQAREAGLVLRAPPTYDEVVGTSAGDDDDDDGLVFPQAAAAAAAAAAASRSSATDEQDLGDGASFPLYQPPTVRTFATVARSVLARSTSLRVPAPPPPSSASSIASYRLDSGAEDVGDGHAESSSANSPHSAGLIPLSASGSPMAHSATLLTNDAINNAIP